MSGERQGGREAISRMADKLIESGMDKKRALNTARNAARRADDGRRDTGHKDSKNRWSGGDERR